MVLKYIHNFFISSPQKMEPSCSVFESWTDLVTYFWRIEWGRSNSTRLVKLGHKQHPSFFLACSPGLLALEEANCHVHGSGKSMECGGQNSKIIPNFPPPALHILGGPLHLSLGRTYEYDRIFLSWPNKVIGKSGRDRYSHDYIMLFKAAIADRIEIPLLPLKKKAAMVSEGHMTGTWG